LAEAFTRWFYRRWSGCASYSAAASLTYRAGGVRIVTGSSAAVRCSAMMESKSALAAYIFTAMSAA